MVVYDRRPHLGDEHGAEGLALLVVGAEAHSAYEQIYGGRFRGNPPFDSGSSGVHASFQVTIALSEVSDPSCMRRRKGTDLPGFLLVGTDNTRPWPGYDRLENVHSTFGVEQSAFRDMELTASVGFRQLRAGKRREHAERVRPSPQGGSSLPFARRQACRVAGVQRRTATKWKQMVTPDRPAHRPSPRTLAVPEFFAGRAKSYPERARG